MKRWIWLIGFLLLLWIPLSTAQSSTLLAFLNGSGQLVVSSGDGSTRWIVTNPGQKIDQSAGFAWTQDGDLVFALSGTGIFVADPNTQQISPVETSDVATLSHLRGLSNRPNIPQPQGVSGDGQFAFIWSQGQYGMVSLNNNASIVLPIAGDLDARGSGIWADNAPIVAYWGFSGSSALSVFHPPTGNSLTIDSGSTVPIPPISWRPNSTQLVFRTATGDIMIADVGCIVNGCSENPLENGISVAPSSANHIQVAADQIYYVDREQVVGVDLNCVNNDTCLDSRFLIGQNVAPLSMMHVGGDRLVYTSYASAPNNPTDRSIQLVDLRCAPNCAPQTIINGAMAGLLSPSGDYLMVDVVGQGLNIVDFGTGSAVYLTDTLGGQLGLGLNTARWQ